MTQANPILSLIMSGGGARAAYQVGVLCAVAELLPAGGRNPFPVISGASAGAINAAVLAAFARSWHDAVERLELQRILAAGTGA